MKKSQEGVNSKFDQAGQRIHDSEDRLIEIIDSQEKKRKIMKKSEYSLNDLWGTIK